YRLMKKLLLITIVFLFAFTANVFGQSSQTGNVEVDAEIVAALGITINTHLDFGLLSADEDAYLSTDADGEDESQGIISGQQLGEFTVDGTSGEGITISFPTTITLAREGSTTGSDLTYTPTLSADIDGTQEELESDVTNLTLDGTGEIDVTVGGGVDSNEVAAGTFDGTLEVTASYVSF
ncbi:MAG: DUF4402 domain-containing protein, partial [Balneolaceae bacterium]